MPIRTTVTTEVAEGASAVLNGTLTDEAGDTVTSPSSVTMVLYDEDTDTVITASTDISSSVTSGVMAHTLSAAQNAIQTAGRKREVHVALIEFAAGTTTGKAEIAFPVVNLKQVT